MDTAGNTWKQHLVAVGFRLLCMVIISFTGLMAGTDSSPERADGTEQSPGVAGLLFVAGVVAALVFAFVASLIHFAFRRRPLKTILIADALLAAGFIAFMVYSSTKASIPTKPRSGRPMEQAVCARTLSALA
ncbi:MAG: hypothetical protein B9S33_04295 [Pedosphaera sp. Tous-C6FEB]|nr:MAG: hypothetical protein B9S33_04295 [Pedosphaera sp. Tous-C6FEB]